VVKASEISPASVQRTEANLGHRRCMQMFFSDACRRAFWCRTQGLSTPNSGLLRRQEFSGSRWQIYRSRICRASSARWFFHPTLPGAIASKGRFTFCSHECLSYTQDLRSVDPGYHWMGELPA